MKEGDSSPGNFLMMYYTKFYKKTLRHGKTTTLYFCIEQELHSDEMFYKTCVPPGDIFWR